MRELLENRHVLAPVGWGEAAEPRAWLQSHPSQPSTGVALGPDGGRAGGELGVIAEEACPPSQSGRRLAMTGRLRATGQMQAAATALSVCATVPPQLISGNSAADRSHCCRRMAWVGTQP